MFFVGIDVAKDKHDCCILGSNVRSCSPHFPSLITVAVSMFFMKSFSP